MPFTRYKSKINSISNIYSMLRELVGHRNCYFCAQASRTVICQTCELDVIHNDEEGIFLSDHSQHKVSVNLLNNVEVLDQLLPPAFSSLYTLAEYQWPITRLIRDLKFAGKAICADILVDCVIHRFNPYIFDNVDALVPIPLSFLRYVNRQYNQSQLIAETLSWRLNIPCIDILRRPKQTRAQAKLGKEKRVENTKNAFVATTYLKSFKHLKHIVLIDDVLTTGATLNAACKAIVDELPEIQISVLVMAIALPKTQ